MRVIAGEFRSRQLKTLTGDTTRPTSDKIKGAIFSRVGPYFDGGVMLDLFAGSGSVGIEALSRGMDYCYFADKDGAAVRVIYENIRSLKIEDKTTVWKMDFIQVLKKALSLQLEFDLIFIDPPYQKYNLDLVMETITSFGLLKDQGVLVVETHISELLADNYDTIIKEKESEYGTTKITYYRKGII